VERVALLRRLERHRAPDALREVPLPLDDVRPGRRARVLEVAHEDLRARVERVDQHLAVGRAGDLDAPVLQVDARRRDLPGARGPGHELELRARIPLALALLPAFQELDARGVEGAVEALDEVESLPRQNDLLRLGRRHAAQSSVTLRRIARPRSTP